jgi:hypothetical protein
MAQDHCVTLVCDRDVCVYTVGFDEGDSFADVAGKALEALPGLVEHGCGGIEQRQFVASLGQGKRLVPGAATDVEYGCGGWWEMLQQLGVHHKGPQEPLGGCVASSANWPTSVAQTSSAMEQR